MMVVFQVRGQWIVKNGRGVRRKPDQRCQSSQLDICQIDQQMPTCGSISTPFPDRCFFFCWRPAFSQAFYYFLATSTLPPGPPPLNPFCHFSTAPNSPPPPLN